MKRERFYFEALPKSCLALDDISSSPIHTALGPRPHSPHPSSKHPVHPVLHLPDRLVTMTCVLQARGGGWGKGGGGEGDGGGAGGAVQPAEAGKKPGVYQLYSTGRMEIPHLP